MSEVMVSIPAKEYDELISEVAFLNCLRGAGVDNWDGYDIAYEMFEEEKNDRG